MLKSLAIGKRFIAGSTYGDSARAAVSSSCKKICRASQKKATAGSHSRKGEKCELNKLRSDSVTALEHIGASVNRKMNIPRPLGSVT
jgi:hypothetical protein